jgi:fatty-acyl-CoA synthase
MRGTVVEVVGSPLAMWIERHARSIPGKLAVATRDGSGLTFGELDRRANQLAHAMVASGLEPGDRIALWLDDSIPNIETYVAAAKVGLVLTPVNARLQSAEMNHILSSCAPRAVLYSDSVAERLERCQSDGATDGRLLWATGSELLKTARSFEEDVANGSVLRPGLHPYHPDDPFVLAFSSGTTGRAKGVAISGRGIEHVVIISALARRLSYFGASLMTSSLSFPATIMASVFTNLYMASSVILMGQGWDIDELLQCTERFRATYLTVLSPHVQGFAEAARSRPEQLRTVRSILHSGSKVPARDLAALYDAIGPRLIEVWGMIEHSGGPVTATTIDDYAHAAERNVDIFASVGRAAAQCEVDLVDADGELLPHDGSAVGELVVRSPALMTGYWRDPDATELAMRGGWYHSGDLGTIDEHGYIYVVDRRHDLIVSGGANIYPSEVERVLVEFPGVKEAVVVGIPHERWGKTAVAAVIADRAANLSLDDLLAYVRQNLASYKKPTQIKVVERFPLNASGKIVRNEVAALFDPAGTTET